jgi:RNA polymerase sigma factor (sigma-70 family)
MPQTVAAQTFADFRDKLAGFIRKRVSRIEDAEDILQECFYQFTRMDELGKPVEQTAAWLYRVARNLIINRYKKKQEVQLPEEYNDYDTNFLDEITDAAFGGETTPETEF